MPPSDFDQSPQATADHERRTGLTYLSFLQQAPAIFYRHWQELTEADRIKVRSRLRQVGATDDQMKGLE